MNIRSSNRLLPVNGTEQFSHMLRYSGPILALAPMQDVTDLPFWKLMTDYGGADVYFTEYFRVHPTSNLEKWILKSITGNPTGRPVIAQMIGNDIPALVRTARELQQYPIAAVDLHTPLGLILHPVNLKPEAELTVQVGASRDIETG